MAVSSSIDFSISEKTIIASALRICGQLSHGKEPSRDIYESARFALNLIVKETDAHFKPWVLKTSTAVTTVAGTSTYNVVTHSLPSDIDQIRSLNFVYGSNDDRKIDLINQSRYDAIVDKSLAGDPIYGFLQDAKNPADKTLVLWPVPNTAKSLRIRYTRLGYDMDADADEIDFPIYWGNYLRYELAASLAEEFGLPDSKVIRLMDRAARCLEKAKAKAVVKTDNLTPETRKYY